jgi:chromosome segregation ATPase
MAETKKYLDQAGLQLVLSKLTNKYDKRFLGLHAMADMAAKTEHKLTINVGDEEARVFDGSTDYEIDVAAAEHRHPASEIDFTHAGMSGVANVNEALDVLIKNVQIASGVLSSTTANMQTLKDALDKEVTDRDAAVKAEETARKEADTGLDNRIKALEALLNGSGNVNEAILAVKELLNAEVQRSTAKDNEHDTAIANHKSRLETIEGEIGVAGSIKDAVNVEKLRAEGKESELNTAITNEKSRAELAEQGLQKAISDEETARKEADNGLSDRINTNKTAIEVLNGDENTEGSVAKDIKEAEARVEVVTNALDGRVTDT